MKIVFDKKILKVFSELSDFAKYHLFQFTPNGIKILSLIHSSAAAFFFELNKEEFLYYSIDMPFVCVVSFKKIQTLFMFSDSIFELYDKDDSLRIKTKGFEWKLHVRDSLKNDRKKHQEDWFLLLYGLLKKMQMKPNIPLDTKTFLFKIRQLYYFEKPYMRHTCLRSFKVMNKKLYLVSDFRESQKTRIPLQTKKSFPLIDSHDPINIFHLIALTNLYPFIKNIKVYFPSTPAEEFPFLFKFKYGNVSRGYFMVTQYVDNSKDR